ncbi:tyrosine-type recombinase/integrase [Virgisporangium ochraceum]|uniref:Integrase family protein n=1 Tax=Virgisporangium ochraceum TaxID=65505 RepID=A0A8J3ZVU5_9ACTN|nr:site-specific integrase [Virgisporangium ochraceum]GIJ69907.1 hypothetical protein Voc01_048240 [Virgisporangium ochraceum]
MAVDDRWYLSKKDADGRRVPSARHGRGKRWRVRYLDDAGVPRERMFERKPDAELFDANVRADVSRGQYIDNRAGKVTVAEYGTQWRANQIHADTTVVKVELAFRLHIEPRLGHMSMAAVRTSHIQAWLKDRAEVLAATTLQVVFSYVRSMFATAVLDRIIGTSPCAGVSPPAIERRDYYIPTPGQVHALAEAIDGRYSAAVYVAAGCGLRLGEVLGLEVGNIDFLRREIHVRHQLKVVKGRKPYLGPLKTKNSYRSVELPDELGLALAAHIKAEHPKAFEVDDLTNPRKPLRREANIMFPSVSGDGLIQLGASWSRLWTPARKAAGLPERWGMHGLRHYYATLLIHAGASVKTVQMALGHSNPTITLNTYVGEWPEALDRTRALVSKALWNADAAARSVVGRA